MAFDHKKKITVSPVSATCISTYRHLLNAASLPTRLGDPGAGFSLGGKPNWSDEQIRDQAFWIYRSEQNIAVALLPLGPIQGLISPPEQILNVLQRRVSSVHTFMVLARTFVYP